MKASGWIMKAAAAAAAAAALSGCGKLFPAGERLLPQSYGPPFGAGLKDNLPEHPHTFAAEERYAQVDAVESKTFRSHGACHVALEAALRTHGDHAGWQRISLIETIGTYEVGGVVHEHRCTDYVLSHRSWCAPAQPGAGGHDAAPTKPRADGHDAAPAKPDGEGHGAARKKPGPGCGGEASHP